MMICYYSFDGLHLTLNFFSRESDPARSTIIISWDFAPITGQEITVKPRGAPDSRVALPRGAVVCGNCPCSCLI